MFQNRDAAGRELAAKLKAMKLSRPVVFALPRGGVPVGAVVARELGCPLDVVIVRKIGHPRQPELALGAVVDGRSPIVIRNEEVIAAAGIGRADFDALAKRQAEEVARRKRLFGAGRAAFDPAHDTAIIVDDGLATGATARAAIAALRQQKTKKIVMAVPVAASDSLALVESEADEVVCLLKPQWFSGVSAFYEEFSQVPDEDVVALLEQAGAGSPAPGEHGA